MSDPEARTHGPLILDLDETPLPEAPSPAKAPPVDTPAAAEQALRAAARPRRAGLGTWVLGLLFSFFMLWLGVAATDFIAGLFARYAVLGWIGTGLLAAAGIGLVVGIVREMAALARLGRVETLRLAASRAERDGDSRAAAKVLDGVEKLYAGRADLEWARSRMAGARGDTPDALARLRLAERTYLAGLDREAAARVSRASRDVAAATALIPLALVDVLAALYCNLSMVRSIAEIYGGRAGWLGSWRLMKAVATHLVATGAVAITDDVVGPMVGGGVLGKLSRRFGEGVVNGALTARVGVAAIEVCRPLPFAELERPSSSTLLVGALRSWRRESERDPS